jgi:FixJ family two-component response regulator
LVWVVRDRLQRGATACLFKPFNESVILEAVSTALGTA